MQLNIKRRTIWLTRHGESQYNLENRIGGDPSLTESGVKYGLALGKFLQDYYQNKRLTDARNSVLSQNRPSFTDDMQSGCSTKTNVWTSTLNRTIETVESFDDNLFDVKHIRFLNEIYAGTMENLTYDEFENLHTDEYNTRMKNKLQYRYPGPGGESYLDVIERLRPLIIELERMESDTVICTHNVVMRTLVAYFVGMQLDKMPTLGVPLHTLYRLRPVPYGCELTRYSFDESSGELVEME